MMSSNGRGLGQRLDRLEDQALDREIDVEAARLGALVGCDPAVLLERAQAIAETLGQHGYHRTVELVAAGVGLSPEQLEAGAARLEPDS